MQDNPFDKACRYLIKLDPAGVLAWLLRVSIASFTFIRWLDTRRLAFPGQPDRTCDTVAHVERLGDNHRPWSIVAEFNIEPDALMFGRMLGYLGTLWIEEKPTIERGDRFELGALLVNLTGRGDSSRCSDWPETGMRSDLNVAERNLSTYDAEQVLRDIADGKTTRAVLPWIPLMRNGGDLGIIEKWKELASADPNAQRRADYGGLVLVFAEAAKCWDDWKLALKEWNVIESKQVKEWQDQARKDGRQEGHQEGRLEGRQEGQRENSLTSLLAVLNDKYGALPDDVPSHLKAIGDFTVLQQLLLKAVRAGSLDDFRKSMANGTK
jgi:hypothetical protein